MSSDTLRKKDLLRLSKKELIKICKKYGAKTTGNKSEMINHILTMNENKLKEKANKKKLEKISSKTKSVFMDKLTPDKCFIYLIFGYIRTYYIKTAQENDFPSPLITLITEYMKAMFMNFDLCRDEYKDCINDYGFNVKRCTNYDYKQQVMDRYSPGIRYRQQPIPFIIGCSKGYKKGIHTFDIKMIRGEWGTYDTEKYDAIGVTSDINICKNQLIDVNNPYCQWPPTFIKGYFWSSNKLYKGHITYNLKYRKYDHIYSLYKIPKANDVITLSLNCKKWKLTFKQN
eukprot:456190_1